MRRNKMNTGHKRRRRTRRSLEEPEGHTVFVPADTSSFFHYDDLRKSLVGVAATNISRPLPTVKSVRHQQSSSVLKVTTENRNGHQLSYRLCHLALMLPFTNGKQVRLVYIDAARAALLAIHHLNNGIESVVENLKKKLGYDKRHGQHCDVRFTVDFYDTELSPTHSARLLSKSIQSRPFPYEATAVVGASRSAVSVPLSILNSIWGTPQISHASTSTSLDSRDSHGMFGRVIPSSDGDANAAVDYLANVLGVTHFAILYVNDDYGASHRQALRETAKREGVETVSFGFTFYQDEAGRDPRNKDRIVDAIENIKKTKYRYIVSIIFQRHVSSVLDEAVKAEIIGPGYFWLMGDGVNSRDLDTGVVKYPLGSPFIDATHGIGIIVGGIDSSAKGYDNFMQEWQAEDEEDFREYFVSKQPLLTNKVHFSSHNFSTAPTQWPILLYDALISLGIAACGVNGTFFSGESLFDSFLEANFDGASGRVEIDRRTGSRHFSTFVYSIQNVVAKAPDDNGNVGFGVYTAAEYVPAVVDKTSKPHWIFPQGRSFNYSDKTFNPPYSLPPLDENMNLIGWGVKGFGLALGTFVIISAICFAAWTCHHRERRIVKASQPMFLMVVCIGVCIMGTAFIPFSLQEPPISVEVANVNCMAPFWLFFTGAALAFSALFSKLRRINKIMSTPQFRRLVVLPREVASPCLFLLSTNMIVLSVWQAVSPLKYERSYSGSYDKFGRQNSSSGFCTSQEGNPNALIFLSLLLIVNGVVLLIANIQAFQARKITTEYSESQYIAIIMGLLLQTLAIGVPVLLSAADSPRSTYAVGMVMMFVSSGAILFLLFVPKVLYLHQDRRRRSQMRMQKQQRLRAAAEAVRDWSQNQGDNAERESDGGNRITASDEERMQEQAVEPSPVGLEILRHSCPSDVELHTKRIGYAISLRGWFSEIKLQSRRALSLDALNARPVSKAA